MKIYLAGYIQGTVLQQCLSWRQYLRDYYKEHEDWIFLDPLNGKNLATITPDGLKSDIPRQAIIHRDYRSVVDSDVIVVNMNTFGEIRPLTGTICELAWAWEHHKPIIMVSDETKYTAHPFIVYMASIIVPTVEEIVRKDYLGYFYKGWNKC
jgi:hypothetical protein